MHRNIIFLFIFFFTSCNITQFAVDKEENQIVIEKAPPPEISIRSPTNIYLIFQSTPAATGIVTVKLSSGEAHTVMNREGPQPTDIGIAGLESNVVNIIFYTNSTAKKIYSIETYGFICSNDVRFTEKIFYSTNLTKEFYIKYDHRDKIFYLFENNPYTNMDYFSPGENRIIPLEKTPIGTMTVLLRGGTNILPVEYDPYKNGYYCPTNFSNTVILPIDASGIVIDGYFLKVKPVVKPEEYNIFVKLITTINISLSLKTQVKAKNGDITIQAAGRTNIEGVFNRLNSTAVVSGTDLNTKFRLVLGFYETNSDFNLKRKTAFLSCNSNEQYIGFGDDSLMTNYLSKHGTITTVVPYIVLKGIDNKDNYLPIVKSPIIITTKINRLYPQAGDYVSVLTVLTSNYFNGVEYLRTY